MYGLWGFNYFFHYINIKLIYYTLDMAGLIANSQTVSLVLLETTGPQLFIAEMQNLKTH